MLVYQVLSSTQLFDYKRLNITTVELQGVVEYSKLFSYRGWVVQSQGVEQCKCLVRMACDVKQSVKFEGFN